MFEPNESAPEGDRASPNGRRVLLVGHGATHGISRHHHCLPLCIDDIRRGRVHTLDVDPGCDPTFVADASSYSARAVLPRTHYDSVVTMHVPCFAWLSRPSASKRKRSGVGLLRQTFFRNVHGALKRGGELVIELPVTALSILDPLGRGGRPGRAGRGAVGRGAVGRSPSRDRDAAEKRCGVAARAVADGARAPGGAARLFELSDVGWDHCVLRKI
jgi:hypothetical protein